MPQVRLSRQANIDLDRLYAFLAKHDLAAADSAIDTIFNSFGLLETLPTGCPLVLGSKDIRKLVIAFGAKGYLAFYAYNPILDAVTIAKIQHQLESYDHLTVGKLGSSST
jgi:plasmid stabilization system protein ParE